MLMQVILFTSFPVVVLKSVYSNENLKVDTVIEDNKIILSQIVTY